MKGNISVISYDCYQQATEKQLEGLKWKENGFATISPKCFPYSPILTRAKCSGVPRTANGNWKFCKRNTCNMYK